MDNIQSTVEWELLFEMLSQIIHRQLVKTMELGILRELQKELLDPFDR